MKTRLPLPAWPSPARLALWVALPMAHTPNLEGRMRMILDQTRPRRGLTRRVLLVALVPSAAALVSLAMLRPEVRAQAASLAVPASPPPAVPPTAAAHPANAAGGRRSLRPAAPHKQVKPQGRDVPVTGSRPRPASLVGAVSQAVPPLKTADPPKAPVRVAQLLPAPAATPTAPVAAPPAVPAATARDAAASDVSLQLVGVTDGRGKWWDAAGALLPQPLYDTAAYHDGPNDYWRKNLEGGKPARDFAFRVSPADAKDVTIRFSLQSPDAPWTSSWGTWMEKMQGQDGQTEAQLNRTSGGLRVMSASYSDAPTPGTIHAAVASGPWKEAVTAHVSVLGPAQCFGAHAYFFSQLFEADGKVRVVISTNDTEKDVRVVAVDAQGRDVLPSEIGDSSASGMSQITALFSLPASQIQKMRVETRPFHPVEFKDVAVQPAPTGAKG